MAVAEFNARGYDAALDGLFGILEEPATQQGAAIASLVAEAVEDGQIRQGVEPMLAARLLSGTVNSIIEWYRPGRPGSDRLPAEIVRIVAEGIIPPG